MENPLKNHPVALASMLGGFVALFGQSAFNKTFDALLSIVTERVQFPMTVRTIDYYRSISDPCSVQVRNTIEGLNARIEYEHEANRQRFHLLTPWGFLIDWASTDRWNAVEPIKLDCREPSPVPPGFALERPLSLPPIPSAAEVRK
jgi:hypothetical protein